MLYGDMATCDACAEETVELEVFRVGRTRQRLCGDCHEDAQREADIAAEAESVMGDMMEYGR